MDRKVCKDICRNISTAYPQVGELWMDYPFLCFMVFSQMVSVNTNYFCHWENPVNII